MRKALSPEMLKAVQDGMADAWATFKEYKETQLDTGKRTSADAFGTREFLNGDYLARFSAAVLGIYGNSKDEAIYPVYFIDSAKKPLSGANRYELRFAPGDLASGQRLLVADALRTAFEPARRPIRSTAI